jgi:hypothetical protein
MAPGAGILTLLSQHAEENLTLKNPGKAHGSTPARSATMHTRDNARNGGAAVVYAAQKKSAAVNVQKN